MHSTKMPTDPRLDQPNEQPRNTESQWSALKKKNCISIQLRIYVIRNNQTNKPSSEERAQVYQNNALQLQPCH